MSNKFLVLDGAFAEELVRAHDLASIRADPLWGASCIRTHPAAIRAVHDDYIAAGAHVILTGTYQAAQDNLTRHMGISIADAADLMRQGAEIALQSAAGVNVAVALSLGSYGATLSDGSEYNGSYVESLGGPEKARVALADFHARRLRAYGPRVLARIAYLAFETIPCLVEIGAIADAIAQVRRELLLDDAFPTAWIAVTCRSETEIGSQELVADAAAAIAAAGHCFAVNCTPPGLITGILETVTRAVPQTRDRLIVVYPNKGESWDAVARVWLEGTGLSDDQYAVVAETEWASYGGATNGLLIGGCCRTTPATIHALAARWKARQQ
ncbi:Homocysteine S-methyltransferase [Blastocladiella britannica]|nr:Homocysteine S-methyltransferase [Blastocladiella britannica]